MLELLGSGLFSLWLDAAGVEVKPMNALDVLAWQSSPGLVLAPDPNPVGTNTVNKYLKELVSSKVITNDLTSSQGIWMQSGPMLMANHQGTTPLPAASLTKVATSLAVLTKLGMRYQFETTVGTNGNLKNGVLKGDLILNAGGDPLFVWEEAIALGNTLNRMGIKRVEGNLIINGDFAINFQRHPILAGQFLQQALNYKTWPRAAALQYNIMPKGTPKPELVIVGKVKLSEKANPKQTLLVRHRSLPLHRIVKEMNVFSNNEMAQMLADAIGGAKAVQSIAAKVAKFPESEIQLINGSGLGVENRISPRAASAMFMTLHRNAKANNMTIADLFPTAGFDSRGTMYGRKLPAATVIKTGTLRDVSALAGVMPTRDRGLVWFAIINRGTQVWSLRKTQDKLLQTLEKQLQTANNPPTAIQKNVLPKLGASSRNEVISQN
ncbi:MAG: D-alanyl-D-alanine carboxypeptidase [Cyanobacteria bacterium P01_A01_bin.45]